MAFPGTYNINYYRGDTFEFRIYPKDSSGSAYDLSGYNKTSGAIFTISTARGAAGIADQKEAFARISDDGTYILCAITPDNGADLAFGNSYVYDVQISKSGANYDSVITVLTGNITMTEQVTGATV
jgi:hypothetical protein